MTRGSAIDGYALGQQSWQQPIAGAPDVADGVHLRWSFSPHHGLPWFGYWVLRFERRGRSDSDARRRSGASGADRSGDAGGDGGTDTVGTGGSTALMAGPTSAPAAAAPRPSQPSAALKSPLASPNPMPVPWLAGLLDGADAGRAAADVVGGAEPAPGAARPRRQPTPARDPGVKGPTFASADARSRLGACPWTVLTAPGAPIRLPVTHPAYPPTAGKIPDLQADIALARARVRYGDADAPFATAADGASPFAELRPWLIRLVEGGPDGPPMRRQRLPDQAMGDDSSPAQPQAQLDGRPILDWLALAAVAPANAQWLGLYAIDESAIPGVAYDYLVLADFDGALGGDPIAWLRRSAAGRSGRWQDAGVCGLLFEDVVVGAQPALSPPSDVWGCPLRGEQRPVEGELRKVEDASRVIGLRWQAQRPVFIAGGRGDERHFDGPLHSYHVWRGFCGADDAPGPVETLRPLVEGQPGSAWSLPTPIVAVDGAPIASRAGDPMRGRRAQPRLHLHDVVPRDGHYAYVVARSDVFGRFSPRSAPAAFRPLPDDGLGSRFYSGRVADFGVLHNAAIEVRSDLAPPPPQGLVAVLHDPEDPNDVSYRAPKALLAALLADDVRPADAKAEADALAASPYWQWSSHVGTRPGLVLELSWRWSWAASRRTPGLHGFRVELEREVDGAPQMTVLAEVPFVGAAAGWQPRNTFEVRRDGQGRMASGVGLAQFAMAPKAVRLGACDFDLQALRPGQDQVLLQDDAGAEGPVYVLADVFVGTEDDGSAKMPETVTWLRLDAAPQVGDAASCGWAIGESGLEWRLFLPVDGEFALGSWRQSRVTGRVRVVAVGAQASRPESVGAGPVLVERVRRRWAADAPRLVIEAPETGLVASAPDAQGRSFVEVPWRLEGVDSLPLPEGLTVAFSCVSDLEIYAAEAEAQPRALEEVSAGPGTLRAELLPEGVVVTAAEADEVRTFFAAVREFALGYSVEFGAGLGAMTVDVAREQLASRLAAGVGDGDVKVWRAEISALQHAVDVLTTAIRERVKALACGMGGGGGELLRGVWGPLALGDGAAVGAGVELVGTSGMTSVAVVGAANWAVVVAVMGRGGVLVQDYTCRAITAGCLGVLASRRQIWWKDTLVNTFSTSQIEGAANGVVFRQGTNRLAWVWVLL